MTDTSRERDTAPNDATATTSSADITTPLGREGRRGAESETELYTPSIVTLGFKSEDSGTLTNENVGDWDWDWDIDEDGDIVKISYGSLSNLTLVSDLLHKETEFEEGCSSTFYDMCAESELFWEFDFYSDSDSEFDEFDGRPVRKTGLLPDCWACEKELDEFPPTVCNECGLPN